MSIKSSILALLAEEPTHGYGLKTTFEASTAGAWPLNIGQVYTTLARLQRDGLVESAEPNDPARRTWTLTQEGREALRSWFEEPVEQDAPPRDELAIKVLLAASTGSTDVRDILQRQREATMERLQRTTRLKREADPQTDVAWLLLLDAMSIKAEGELRWLDLCEVRLGGKG
ncbi:MAG: PadR family transcriptional regulator [Planctomycetota bacterium]